jgi:hypothetical protein
VGRFYKGGLVLQILAIAVGIGSLVCWIIVLVKLFQNGYTVPGIIGIICALVAFIYGWMKADELGVKNIMLVWTGLIVASIVLNVAAASMAR